ncbi:MAG TPA: hypothetical protein VFL17_01610 [Anaerolineae bacterium]|nr:hypothetical protein [Anaerolineae bacterium]
MKINRYQILGSVIMLLFLSAILVGIPAFQHQGWIDFPCSVRYVRKDDCLLPINLEGWRPPQIESALDRYEAGWSGEACDYHTSDTRVLFVQTPILNLSLEIVDDTLKVNGSILDKGAEFQAINILNWNPWRISRIRFENLGLLPYCDSRVEGKTLQVYGRYGTEVSPIKGVLLLCALAGGQLLVYRKSRQAAKHNAA